MTRCAFVSHWDEFLRRFAPGSADIYFTQSYAALHAAPQDRPCCYVYEDDGEVFLLPLILREILPYAPGYYDFESPYGYGGPIASNGATAFWEKALAAFSRCCRDQRMVVGFVRMHPLLGNAQICAPALPVAYNRSTVAVNLQDSAEDIWTGQIHPKHRNSIRNAEKHGLRFELDDTFACLEDFMDIYAETMAYCRADSAYLFPRSYFTSLRDSLREKALLGLVRLDERVIAVAIFLQYGPFAHYHLAGSRVALRGLSPNNFLLYQAILSLKERNKHWLHLGGGSNALTDNSLLRFKERFSPHRFDFYTASWTFDVEKRRQIQTDWALHHPRLVPTHGHLTLCHRYQEGSYA